MTWPAASRSRSSRRDRCRRSSTAQHNGSPPSANWSAQASRPRWSLVFVPIVMVANCRPAGRPRQRCACACAHRSRASPCRVSFASKGNQGPVGGHIPVRGDATLLSSHAGPILHVRRAALLTMAINGRNRTSEPTERRDHRHRGTAVTPKARHSRNRGRAPREGALPVVRPSRQRTKDPGRRVGVSAIVWM